MKEPILVFDGYCRVCINLVKLINVTGLFPSANCISFYELPQELKILVDEDRFKNELAFLDPTEGVLYGPHGVKKAISYKKGFLSHLLGIPLIFSLFIFVYKIIAYNRYVILLPKESALECDCGPDKERKYRNYYFIILSLLSLLTVTLCLKICGLHGIWLWLNLLTYPFLYLVMLLIYKIIYPNTYHFDLRQHSLTSLFYSFGFGGVVIGGLKMLLGNRLDLLIIFLLSSSIAFFIIYQNRIRFLQLKQVFVYLAISILFVIPLLIALI